MNKSSLSQTGNAQCQRDFFLGKLSVTATELTNCHKVSDRGCLSTLVLDKINWKKLSYPRDYRTNRQPGLQVVNSSSLIEFFTLLEELNWIDVRQPQKDFKCLFLLSGNYVTEKTGKTSSLLTSLTSRNLTTYGVTHCLQTILMAEEKNPSFRNFRPIGDVTVGLPSVCLPLYRLCS